MHKVHNSWRRLRWTSSLNKGRRDSAILAHFGFNFSRYKLAAKDFQVGDNHVRAVLAGAANSSALYQVVLDGHTKVGCDWCHRNDDVSSWRHLGFRLGVPVLLLTRGRRAVALICCSGALVGLVVLLQMRRRCGIWRCSFCGSGCSSSPTLTCCCLRAQYRVDAVLCSIATITGGPKR